MTALTCSGNVLCFQCMLCFHLSSPAGTYSRVRWTCMSLAWHWHIMTEHSVILKWSLVSYNGSCQLFQCKDQKHPFCRVKLWSSCPAAGLWSYGRTKRSFWSSLCEVRFLWIKSTNFNELTLTSFFDIIIRTVVKGMRYNLKSPFQVAWVLGLLASLCIPIAYLFKSFPSS